MEKLQMLVAALCLLLPRVAWGDDPCTPCSGNCGESLGTLSGVDAFSNGARGDCTGTGRGFYQCVEYAKRFHGRTGERWGNANQIFDRAERLDLRSFRNGETEAPRQGDAITFRGGRYGHIAIIYEVGSNFITLIEQNWHNIPGRFRRLDMDVESGRYTVVSDSRIYTVEGWLRPAVDPTTTDDDGDTLSEVEGDCDDSVTEIHPGVPDNCDYLDNNCDGITDNGFDLVGEPCVAWVLECRIEGTFVCSSDGLGEACHAIPPTVEPERCDSIDNDCDGETDEDWRTGLSVDFGEPCEIGLGECRRSGVWVCEPLGRGVVCNAEFVSGTSEVCDGLDNDCNGETDEDWPEIGTSCVTSPCEGFYVCTLGISEPYCDIICPIVCGDGMCNGHEYCTICERDCGYCFPVCGDLVCNSIETCSTCSRDCGACPSICGDRICDISENCTICSADCGYCHSYCGDHVCGSSEACDICPADCGTCPACGACHFCGDHRCDGYETCDTCPYDCVTCV